MTVAPDQPFDAPWHAEVFALTVCLSEAGAFSWPDWTRYLCDSLAEARACARHVGSGDHLGAKHPNGGDDYFRAWLAALERILADLGHAEPEILDDLKARWAQAYLTTPHGEPVRLGRGS